MKCPHCGSEDLQYATKTKGGGFSVWDAAVGRMVWGPIGTLKGIQKVKSENFWVCRKCGHTMTEVEGQRQMHKEEWADLRRRIENSPEYREQKRKSEAASRKYSSLNSTLDQVKKREVEYLKEHAGPAAKGISLAWLIVGCVIVFFVLAAVSIAIPYNTLAYAFLMSFIPLLLLIMPLGVWLYVVFRNRARNEFAESDPEYAKILEQKRELKAEMKKIKW